jgi:acylphosphatase
MVNKHNFPFFIKNIIFKPEQPIIARKLMVNVRVHVFVSGRVQGVFFRQNTKRQAESLGVKDWVRNLPDGRVEAVFEGEESFVKTLVDYCRHGPSSARVENVEVNYENYKNEFSDFDTF